MEGKKLTRNEWAKLKYLMENIYYIIIIIYLRRVIAVMLIMSAACACMHNTISSPLVDRHLVGRVRHDITCESFGAVTLPCPDAHYRLCTVHTAQ